MKEALDHEDGRGKPVVILRFCFFFGGGEGRREGRGGGRNAREIKSAVRTQPRRGEEWKKE